MPPAERARASGDPPGAKTTLEALVGIAGTEEVRAAYQEGRIGPSTAVYGLIGPHPEPERAREYNEGFGALGLDAVAVSLVVPDDGDAAEALAALRELDGLDVRGYHIHPPHQETVGQVLDELDPSACRAGKVNAVYTREDKLVGAWVETPAEQFALWTGRHLTTGAPT